MVRLILLFLIIAFFLMLFIVLKQFCRCPSDKIIVVYGKGTGSDAARCYHGGAVFIFPMLQDYAYIDLSPYTIKMTVQSRSLDNIRLNMSVSCIATVSTEKDMMQAAAVRLLNLSPEEISALAHEIIQSQIKYAVSMTAAHEMCKEDSTFIDSLKFEINSNLRKIGMSLVECCVNHVQAEACSQQSERECGMVQARNTSESCICVKINAAHVDVQEVRQALVKSGWDVMSVALQNSDMHPDYGKYDGSTAYGANDSLQTV